MMNWRGKSYTLGNSRRQGARLRLGAGEELAHGGAIAHPAVVKQPLPEFEKPNPAADDRVPAHSCPESFLGMSQEAEQRLGAGLADHLDHFHPEHHPPIRHALAFENLVLVIPAAEIRLDHPVFGLLRRKGGPAMRGGVQGLNLVRIIRQKLPESPPIVAVAFLCKTGHPGGHGDNAVLPHQPDRLAIDRRGAAFVNRLQRGVIGALQTQQEPGDARLLIEVQDIGVPHDIAGPGGADEDEGDVFTDQGL